jgi:hypothetical protein
LESGLSMVDICFHISRKYTVIKVLFRSVLDLSALAMRNNICTSLDYCLMSYRDDGEFGNADV